MAEDPRLKIVKQEIDELAQEAHNQIWELEKFPNKQGQLPTSAIEPAITILREFAKATRKLLAAVVNQGDISQEEATAVLTSTLDRVHQVVMSYVDHTGIISHPWNSGLEIRKSALEWLSNNVQAHALRQVEVSAVDRDERLELAIMPQPVMEAKASAPVAEKTSAEPATKRVVKAVPHTPAATSKADTPKILLLTAADIEYETAIELAGIRDSLSTRRRVVGNHVFLDLGFEIPVWLFQCRAGSGVAGGSLARTSEALSLLNPKPFAVIALGIAFGLQQNKQSLGDLLLAEQIQYYEPQRRGATERISRGDKPFASSALIDWFRSCYSDWHHGESDRPRLYRGVMMSGEKLSDDPAFVRELLELEPQTIGGEMEAAGLYAAAYHAQIHWTVLKAICDWGHGKNDEAHSIAASNAIDFVYHVLSQRLSRDPWNLADRPLVE